MFCFRLVDSCIKAMVKMLIPMFFKLIAHPLRHLIKLVAANRVRNVVFIFVNIAKLGGVNGGGVNRALFPLDGANGVAVPVFKEHDVKLLALLVPQHQDVALLAAILPAGEVYFSFVASGLLAPALFDVEVTQAEEDALRLIISAVLERIFNVGHICSFEVAGLSVKQD